MKEGQRVPKTVPKGLNTGTFEERQEKRLKWDRKILRDFDPEQPDKWPGFISGFWLRKDSADPIIMERRGLKMYSALCYSGIGRHWETGEWWVRMQVPDPSFEHGQHVMYPLSYLLQNYGPENCQPGQHDIDPEWKF